MNTARIIFILVAFIFVTGYTIFYMTGSEEGNVELIIEEEEELVGEAPISMSEEGVVKEKEDIPLDEKFPMDMQERSMQNYIHWMSHQKVSAKRKWGAMLITEERIERLLEVALENEQNYQHSYVYIDILSRWQEGDFSKADLDHNAIWELQGGTIGKATGLLTEEEELAYIEDYFGSN